MQGHEREAKLREIEELLVGFLQSNPDGNLVNARYFIPYHGSEFVQGIQCTCPSSATSVAEDIMGFLDIPAMMAGFNLEVVKSQANGAWNVFVYDEEKFHLDNIKKMRIISAYSIHPIRENPTQEKNDDENW